MNTANPILRIKNFRFRLGAIPIGVIIFLWASSANAQQRISLEELIQISIENNYQNKVSDLEVTMAEYEKAGAAEIPKTQFFVENEDFRKDDKKGEWKVGLEQEIPWPGINKARKNYMDKLLQTHKLNRTAIQAEIKRDVKSAYYELWYLQEKRGLLLQIDSVYQNTYDAAYIRFNVGDVAGLDKLSAEVSYKEIQALIMQIEKDILIQQRELMLLTNSPTYYLPVTEPLEKVLIQETLEDHLHPSLLAQEQEIEAAQSLIEVQKKENYPEISIRAFSQSYLGIKDPMYGFAVGVAFPLFGLKTMKNQMNALRTDIEVQESQLEWEKANLETEKMKALAQVEKEKIMLDFYEESGLEQSKAIIKAASLSYKSGEIGFADLSEFLIQANSIKEDYLDALNDYNQSAIEYLYLSNQD